MKFNVKKCVVLRCTRLLSSIQPTYSLESQPLQSVTNHLFLGIMLDSKLSFSTEIKYAAAKTTKTLNIIRRNLYKCSQSTKAKAYSSMVHPVLEYCSAVWDPHFHKDIYELEKVQRRAARWAISDYNWSSSVTFMLELLQCPTLSNRRYASRLHMFYNNTIFYISLCHPLTVITTNTAFFQEQFETGIIYHMT